MSDKSALTPSSVVSVLDTDECRLLRGDGLLVMQSLGMGSVDCIITDPPYWTLDKWRAVGTTTRLGGARNQDERDPRKWFKTIDTEYLWECIIVWGNLLPKNGHCWIMSDHETLTHILGYVRHGETPFSYSKPFPVLKRRLDGIGFKQGMGYHGRASHEYVTLLEKGRRRFNDENWPDVFEFPWTGDRETRDFTGDGKPYPTAKPIALYERLIELSTERGQTVLDPFAGSGTCAVAAIRSGRRSICADIEDLAIRTTIARTQSERRAEQPSAAAHLVASDTPAILGGLFEPQFA